MAFWIHFLNVLLLHEHKVRHWMWYERNEWEIELRSWKQHRIFNIYQNFFVWWFWSLFRIRRVLFPVLQIFIVEFLIPMANNSLVMEKNNFCHPTLVPQFTFTVKVQFKHKFVSFLSSSYPKILRWFCSFAVQFFDSWPIVLYIIYYCNSTLKLYDLLFLQYCHTIFCPKFIPLAIPFTIYFILFIYFLCSYDMWFFCNGMNVWLTV